MQQISASALHRLPPGSSFSAPPDSLTVFRTLTYKGGVWEERGQRKVIGREGEKRWRPGWRAREMCRATKVASSSLYRSLVERWSWAADLACPKILA